MKRRTDEEKAAIIAQVEEARKNGSTFRQAVKAAGITDHTYYNWKSKAKRRARKTAPKAAPQLIQIPLDSDMPLVIVMGKAGEVQHALNRLTLIRGTA